VVHSNQTQISPPYSLPNFAVTKSLFNLFFTLPTSTHAHHHKTALHNKRHR